MAINELSFEILEDGTIRFKTENFGQFQHASAEEFLTLVAHLAGGARTKAKRTDVHRNMTVKPHVHIGTDGKPHGG
jgi:hypothetical protein